MRTALVMVVAACAGLVLGASPARAQAGGGDTALRAQVAGLTEDLAALRAQVARLAVDLEQARRENAELRRRLEAQEGGAVVTAAQLNAALTGLKTQLEQADASQRAAILGEVTRQIERLGQQTQAGLDSLAAQANRRPAGGAAGGAAPARTFATDFPQTGLEVTVAPGDTLSGLARRHNAREADIINANRLENPDRLVVGQKLFVPVRQ